jgi:hypothetical protein
MTTLLKLFWTGQQLDEMKFQKLGETETPERPNTILLGNFLNFQMVHFPTPNGQRFMSYGNQNMAGLLNRKLL